MIKLIINADDFGYSKIFNEKILDLLKKGFVKSTTVMVDYITKEQENQVNQLIELNKRGNISVGLHIVFDPEKPAKQQIEKQYEKFKNIFGFIPSHLDVHKTIRNVEFTNALNDLAERNNLPSRFIYIEPTTTHTTHKVLSAVPFDISKTIKLLEEVKEGESCEVLCHPGAYDPTSKTSLNEKRELDYKNVIKFQNYLKSHKNIKNISYNEL